MRYVVEEPSLDADVDCTVCDDPIDDGWVDGGDPTRTYVSHSLKACEALRFFCKVYWCDKANTSPPLPITRINPSLTIV